MSSPFESTLAVKGLSETTRSLNKIQRGLSKMVTSELKLIAVPVASKAQELAKARGLTGKTGALVRKIKPFATGSAVGIRETATRKASSGKRSPGSRYAGEPFSYPSVWEFGKRGSDSDVGPRAFMYPAARWGAPQAKKMLAAAFDRLADGS